MVTYNCDRCGRNITKEVDLNWVKKSIEHMFQKPEKSVNPDETPEVRVELATPGGLKEKLDLCENCQRVVYDCIFSHRDNLFLKKEENDVES